MQYVAQKKRYGIFPILALAVLTLIMTVMSAGATPPSDFMEQGSLTGGDGNVRANASIDGLDWGNTGPTVTDSNTGCPAGFTDAGAAFTTVNLSGTEGLFNCGQFDGATTVPIAPVPTTNGTVGTNNIDAIAFVVDPLNTDVDTCGVPQTQDGDPTTYTGSGGEKNGDALIGQGVETWGGPNNTTPKNDVSNVYAVSRTGFTRSPSTPGTGPEKEVFFGGERVINNGDSHFDFEFTQAVVTLSPGSPPGTCQGVFNGHRTHGDFIASIDYTRGGTLGTFSLAIWHCNLDTHSADNSTGWVTDPAANPATVNGKQCDAGSGVACTASSTPTTLADGKIACGTGPHYQVVACADADLTDNVACPPIDAPGIPSDAVKAVTNTATQPCGGWACRDSNGNRVTDLDPNKLMEGGVNLKSLGFSGCLSTFLPHTRTSGSFSATIKDFTIIPFNTCTGAIRIVKQDASSPTPNLLPGACFTVGSSSREVCDNQAAGTNVPGSNPARNTTVGDEDSDVGEICIDGLGSGNYTVTETVVPAGYVGPASSATATVPSPLTTNVECPGGPTGAAVVTFTNTLGSIQWEKRSDITGNLQSGATFTIDGADANASGSNTGEDGPFACQTTTDVDPVTVVDNGANDADADAGQVTVNNVCVGTYTVTETQSPSGFAPDPDNTRVVTVSASEPNPVIGTQGTDTTGRDDCPDAVDGTDTDEADFCNVVGSLIIRKQTKDASTTATNDLLPGACFTITPDPDGDGASRDVCDGDTIDLYSTGGLICLDGVVFTTYTITEKTAPTGYLKDSSAPTKQVSASSTCSGRAATPQSDTAGDVTFNNTPLSRFEIKFICLAPSPSDSSKCTTQAQIACTDDAATPNTLPAVDGGAADTDKGEDGNADTSPTPTFDDLDEYFGDGTTGLVPGIYNCQINIDP